jgi:hypothetical protein
MRCEGIQDRFSAYLEDELEAAERRSIESHVEACVGCRQELALLRRTVSTLQSLEEIEVPPRLTAAIQAGVSAEGGSRWRHLVSRLFFPLHIKLPLEAMALLLVTLGAVYVYRSAPELAQAPRPQAVTERESRDKTTPIARGQRGDWQEQAARKKAESGQAAFVPISLKASPVEIELPNGGVVRLPLGRHVQAPVGGRCHGLSSVADTRRV